MIVPGTIASCLGSIVSLYGVFKAKRRDTRTGFYFAFVGFGMLAYVTLVPVAEYLTSIALILLLGSLLTWLRPLIDSL